MKASFLWISLVSPRQTRLAFARLSSLLLNRVKFIVCIFNHFVCVTGPKVGPTIVYSYATDLTTMYIEWRVPDIKIVQGKVEGYEIFYKQLGEFKLPFSLHFKALTLKQI